MFLLLELPTMGIVGRILVWDSLGAANIRAGVVDASSDALVVLMNRLQNLMAVVQFEVQYTHSFRNPAGPQSDTATELLRLVSWELI